MRAVRVSLLVAAVLLASCSSHRHAVQRPWDLAYPPESEPAPDTIFHIPTGLEVSIDGMLDMLSGARLVCVGETHDSVHAHRVELLVIRELFRRFPGKVAVGMEMFRETQQEALDRWTRGELSEVQFLKESKWYGNWGSDFRYYREILEFARDNRIDVIALNPSKELQEAVSRGGIDNVAGELRERLPEMGPPDPYQKASIQGVFGGHLPTEGMFESFFRVQMLWEESMAERIVGYYRSDRGRDKKMVTITGGWHVRHGFGVPKKVLRRMPMPYAIVLPEEISVPEEKKDQVMEVELPEIPLLPGDFAWMVTYEDLAERLRLGVRLEEKDGTLRVEAVDEGSPAAKAGVTPGSEIVSFDGEPVSDLTDLYYHLERKKEGDSGTLTVRRDGAEEKLAVDFFRYTRKKPH